MENWKVIFSSHQFEVYSAKNYLESEGIETFLQNELAAQIYSNAVDTVKLLVREADLERGMKILIQGGYIKESTA